MDHDGQIAYDLLPMDPSTGYCHGELCRQATAALDSYRSLMHVITPTRTALLAALVQHKCPYDREGVFAAQVARVNRELPVVLKALRAAKAGIVPKCVVPSRSLRPDEMAPAE